MARDSDKLNPSRRFITQHDPPVSAMLFPFCLSMAFISAAECSAEARRSRFIAGSDRKYREAVENRIITFESRAKDVSTRARFDYFVEHRMTPEDLGPAVQNRADLQKTRRSRQHERVITIEELSHPKTKISIREPIVESLDST